MPITGTPIGAEIFFLIASLFAFTLALWILSRLMPFKKQDILTAFRVSIICAGIPFLIRSMNLIFGLPNYQAGTVNMFAMLAEIILLIILIKKVYSQGWGQTGFVWIVTYGAKLATISIISFIMIIFFTNVFTEIYEERMGGKISITDFVNENGEELETNRFIIYNVTASTGGINLTSTVKFLYNTTGVSIKNIDCYFPGAKVFIDIQDEITKYTFKSFNYTGLDLSIWGYAYLGCDSGCIMNSNSAQGTKIVSIESGENATMNLVFYFEGNDSKKMDCWINVTSENPEFSVRGMFSIQYVANQ